LVIWNDTELNFLIMAHSKEFIDAVWRKGRAVPGHVSLIWRKDQCNAWINKSQYGNRNSQFGWEIDRISAGGAYTISNCRPLQYANNVAKGDGRLTCTVTAAPYTGTHRNVST
jgi:hypothetical protein